jgi:carbonic anhydrase
VPRVTVANARNQARILAGKGPIVAQAVRSGQIKVISGVYDIGTGRVNF